MNYKQILILIIIGVFLGYSVFDISQDHDLFGVKKLTQKSSERHQAGGKFTSPLLECLGVEDSDSLDRLHISKSALSDFINKTSKSNNVDSISLYMRDLNDGPWIGINESTKFIGASLFKVPILIAYLKSYDTDPSILSKKIKYEHEIVDNTQYFPGSKEIKVGETYTIEELLHYMIYYSDNNATELLIDNIDNKKFDEVLFATGLVEPNDSSSYKIGVVEYAGFFRILYNASYLTKASSEKALEILSNAEFNKGITANIPRSIVVAHKFGIRTEDSVNQLHDCGIVYYPQDPYILCVMTKGGNFDDLSKSISQISKFIYNQINSNP